MNHKVGFGFHPNEEEIIFYLKLKVLGHDSEVDDVIAEVDILEFEPCQLPVFSVINSNGPCWYFFYKLEYKSLKSKQVKRTTRTGTGFWKVTSKDREVFTEATGQEIGFKKILTYYEGRFPNGKKTNWVIHEYYLKAPDQRTLVLCRLKKKADKKADNSTTPDEGELSFQGPFDDEENPFLLSNLEYLIEDGLLDSPSAPQSYMAMEQGQINQWLGESSVDSPTNMPYQINSFQLASEVIPIHKSQYQSRSHKTVEERVVPGIIELQSEFSRKDKVREATKHDTAVDLPKKEKSSLKLATSDQKGIFTFMDTPQLSHNSNPPSFYLINTLLGIFLFLVVIREVLVFGDWS